MNKPQDDKLYGDAVEKLGEARVDEIIVASKLPSKEACNKLVMDNLWVVKIVLREMNIRSDFRDDMYSIGILGLYRATKTYDSSISRFCTYSKYWVKNFIQRGMWKELMHVYSVPARRVWNGSPKLHCMSLHESFGSDGELIEDTLIDHTAKNAVECVITREYLIAICKACRSIGIEKCAPLIPRIIGASEETLIDLEPITGLSREGIRLRTLKVINLAKEYIKGGGDETIIRRRANRSYRKSRKPKYRKFGIRTGFDQKAY